MLYLKMINQKFCRDCTFIFFANKYIVFNVVCNQRCAGPSGLRFGPGGL